MANTDELIREAARNGEEYLRWQIQIALAADQRAVSLGSIFVGAASVILGFIFSDSERITDAARYLCLFLSLGLGSASILAFSTARPIDMWIPGNRPSSWDEDIKNETPLIDSMKEHNKHIDEQIAENNHVIKRNASLLRWSMGIATCAVLLSVLWGVGLALG